MQSLHYKLTHFELVHTRIHSHFYIKSAIMPFLQEYVQIISLSALMASNILNAVSSSTENISESHGMLRILHEVSMHVSNWTGFSFSLLIIYFLGKSVVCQSSSCHIFSVFPSRSPCLVHASCFNVYAILISLHLDSKQLEARKASTNPSILSPRTIPCLWPRMERGQLSG